MLSVEVVPHARSVNGRTAPDLVFLLVPGAVLFTSSVLAIWDLRAGLLGAAVVLGWTRLVGL